jgi:hypothetical protein
MKKYQFLNSGQCLGIYLLHQDELKTNEIRRGLAAVLFTGIGLSNGEALQATEGFFFSIIREILSVG